MNEDMQVELHCLDCNHLWEGAEDDPCPECGGNNVEVLA